VTNIVTMWGQTDIPDWCLSVRGLPPYPPIPTLASSRANDGCKSHCICGICGNSHCFLLEWEKTRGVHFPKDWNITRHCIVLVSAQKHMSSLIATTRCKMLQNVADEGVDATVLMISWLKRHID
jgi:hypothetical protein